MNKIINFIKSIFSKVKDLPKNNYCDIKTIMELLMDNNFTIAEINPDGSYTFERYNDNDMRILIYFNYKSKILRMITVNDENEWRFKYFGLMDNVFAMIALLSSLKEYINTMVINFDYYKYYKENVLSYDYENYEIATTVVYSFLHKEERYEELSELIQNRKEFYKSRNLIYINLPEVDYL